MTPILRRIDRAIAATVRKHAKRNADPRKLYLAESMVRAIGVGMQEGKKISFSSEEVDTLLSEDEDKSRLWHAITNKRRRVPLIKNTNARSASHGSSHCFEHVEYQHAIRASQLLRTYHIWSGWESDAAAASFLNEPFNEVSRGHRLSARPS